MFDTVNGHLIRGRARNAHPVRLYRALVRCACVEKASVQRMDRPVEACEWRR